MKAETWHSYAAIIAGMFAGWLLGFVIVCVWLWLDSGRNSTEELFPFRLIFAVMLGWWCSLLGCWIVPLWRRYPAAGLTAVALAALQLLLLSADFWIFSLRLHPVLLLVLVFILAPVMARWLALRAGGLFARLQVTGGETWR